MLLQPFRDAAGVGVVLAHAQCQRLGAAQREPAVERTRHGARRILNEAKPLGDVVPGRHQHAADHVGVAVEVLGGRVQDDVGAELQGLLEEGGGEGVVDGEQRFGFARDLAGRCEIAQSHHRVGRCLRVDQLGIRGHGRGDRSRITAVHERERDAHARPDVRHLPVRAAVHIFAAHDVITGREQFHHRVQRRQSRPERKSVERAFQGRDIALERLARGIARAGVLVALVVPQRFLDVGRRLIDGAHDSPAEGIAYVAGMHCACRKAAR